MSKVYMKVTLNLIVDTDIPETADIMEGLDFEVTPNGEADDDIEVYDVEVEDYEVTDSK
jgi:hypothetical protein